MSEVTFRPATDENGYIRFQSRTHEINNRPMVSLAYGKGNLADNGCGAIALYNALLHAGAERDIESLMSELICEGGLWFGGRWGTKPRVLKKCFSRYFENTVSAFSFEGLMKKVESPQAVVVMTAKKKSMHYFLGLSDGAGRYRFYNSALRSDPNRRGSIDGTCLTLEELRSVLSENGTRLLWLIGAGKVR